MDCHHLANDPEIAAAITIAYIKDRYHGGGFDAMKRAVGNSVAGVDERKDRLYREYLASAEFAASTTWVAAQPQPFPQPHSKVAENEPPKRAQIDDSAETAALNRAELDRLTRRS